MARIAPSAAAFGSVGLEFVLSVLLGIFGGRWLDQKFHTNNTFFFLGTFLGVVLAFYVLWRTAQRAQRAVSDDPPETTTADRDDRDPKS